MININITDGGRKYEKKRIIVLVKCFFDAVNDIFVRKA